MNDSPLILFDGVCNLCNRTAVYIMKKDKQKIFRLMALDSDAGKKIQDNYRISSGHFSSFILIENGKIFYKSTAALKVIKKLSGPVKLFYVCIIVPSFIRNLFYDIIAKNRYKWFGKVETCVTKDD